MDKKALVSAIKIQFPQDIPFGSDMPYLREDGTLAVRLVEGNLEGFNELGHPKFRVSIEDIVRVLTGRSLRIFMKDDATFEVN